MLDIDSSARDNFRFSLRSSCKAPFKISKRFSTAKRHSSKEQLFDVFKGPLATSLGVSSAALMDTLSAVMTTKPYHRELYQQDHPVF